MPANKASEVLAAEFGREPAEGKMLVRNLMTRKVVEIDADTPWCCRVDSETYWSM